MRHTLFSLFFSLFGILSSCQSTGAYDYSKNYTFSHADSLRGMLNSYRSSYDVKHYTLDIAVSPEQKRIDGQVIMTALALTDLSRIQVDLFQNLKVDAVKQDGQKLKFNHEGNVIWIDLKSIDEGENFTVAIEYSGKPIEAKNAPWDGGFVWKEDSFGSPWIGVACEGTGASLWWPLKDHLSDEPDSMDIKVRVPLELSVVSNGDLMNIDTTADEHTFHWKVDYSINSYNVTVNIADYAHFSDTFSSPTAGLLPLDYYVLKENKAIAENHFQQTSGVLEAFEYWFGPYPFWNDGFALVETPYLGMEHQGAIAYGNKYMRGYLGRLSPRELDFDYIIVHETGHEYWGNSVSCDDHAEMWIHESFTTYMEALYVEYHHDKEMAIRYLKSQKPYIRNLQPIVGPRDVNFDDWKSSDHYYKGSWVLHSFRHVIPEEKDWREFMQAIYAEFSHSVTNTDAVLDFINAYFQQDYTPFWIQYLYRKDLPILQYKINQESENQEFQYRWKADVEDFNMPFWMVVDGERIDLHPTTKWQSHPLPTDYSSDIDFPVDYFLVDIERM